MTKAFENYSKRFESLVAISEEVEKKMRDEEVFFVQNQNFFTKSFLIDICSYLEMYLKDSIMQLVSFYDGEIRKANIPNNLIRFAVKKDLKDNDKRDEAFSLQIRKKDIESKISANPYLLRDYLINLGIYLEEIDNDFATINSIVDKRNQLIHHDDSSSDITFLDIKNNVEEVKKFMGRLDSEVFLQEQST